MHAVARRGLRWTCASQINRHVDHVSCGFQPHRRLSLDPRPPSGNSENHTACKEEVEGDKQRGDNAEQHDASTGTAEGATPPSETQFRTQGRRSLRNKRLSEAPRPPPIPDWFLKHNVKLRGGSFRTAGPRCSRKNVEFLDRETGHVMFELPLFGNVSWDVFSQGRGTVEETRALPAKAAAELTGAEPWAGVHLRWAMMEAEASVLAAYALAAGSQQAAPFVADRVDLSLQCPDPNAHEMIERLAQSLANLTGSDLIQFSADDFAELANEYVGQGVQEPGSFANLGYEVFQGREAASVTRQRGQDDNARPNGMDELDELNEDEDGENDHDPAALPDLTRRLTILSAAALKSARGAGKTGFGQIIGIVPTTDRRPPGSHPSSRPSLASFLGDHDEGQADTTTSARLEARMDALLDSLLDAPTHKTPEPASSYAMPDTEKPPHPPAGDAADAPAPPTADKARRANSVQAQIDRLEYRSRLDFWLPYHSGQMARYLTLTAAKRGEPDPPFVTRPHDPSPWESSGYQSSEHTSELKSSSHASSKTSRRTLVHVQDLKDIADSRLGEFTIQRLCHVVRKRRRRGEQIVIVGSTSQDTLGPFGSNGEPAEDALFRNVDMPPILGPSSSEKKELGKGAPKPDVRTLDAPADGKILKINLRHIQTMLRRLRPHDDFEAFSPAAHAQLNMPGMRFLTERILSLDQVQRLALVAIGLSQVHTKAGTVQPLHVTLAGFLRSRSDASVQAWSQYHQRKNTARIEAMYEKKRAGEKPAAESSSQRLERVRAHTNAHEKRLLAGVIDPQKIKVGFADVHAPPETIQALKTVTSLSLLRPDAFTYGVLAQDRLPGLLLYGPPGTGKTLLAKAVAKESGATMLEMSGAQINDKYVGESEKMVRAVFTLAKKLSPCVVFIDEADAIFGRRSNSGLGHSHRNVVNQFLREWDGTDDHGVFIMVASNRPFDLDDAVLRRVPRRLLVDLPVQADREAILAIHLRDELLEPSVQLPALAKQTPLYSGSDLKNLVVAAALACVREENETLAQRRRDHAAATGEDDATAAPPQLPEKRVLGTRHFDTALAEISASISEDMGTTKAMKKFDEQFGDGRGRKKKSAYGFVGAAGGERSVDEDEARVR